MAATISEVEQNLRYKLKGEYSYITSSVPLDELESLRKEAEKYIDSTSMRSCWVCNAAHLHFLHGEWGGWVLICTRCTRYYFNGVDISIYGEEDEDQD